MSDSTTTTKQKEGIFTKKHRRLLVDPFNDNNPITVQVLGICSALAVTNKVMPAIVMAIAVTCVTGIANLVISLMRKGIPPKIRMIVQLVVIAALVTVVEQVLHAFVYDTYKSLAVYIGLIITNCIVMGRLEAYAMANKPWQSFLDGIGNGVGYGAILIVVAVFRELFGSGTILGLQIMPKEPTAFFVNNGVMLTPAAAMFLIGIIIWFQRSKFRKLIDVS